MSTVTMIMAIILAALFALVALEVLIIIISAWALGYAGVIFLGFGGGRWTSDMAINYYKTIFQVGVQIMVITLLMGVGKDIVLSYASSIGTSVTARGLMTLIIVVIVFYGLFLRVPSLVSGVALGSFGAAGVGGGGGGGALGSSALGAIGTGIAAASMGKAMLESAASGAVGGAVSVGGGASTVKAAFGGAMEASKNSSGMFSGGSWGEGQSSSVMKAFGEAAQFTAEVGRQMKEGAASMAAEDKDSAPSFGDRVKASAGGRLAEHIQAANQGDERADTGAALRSATGALDPNGDSFASDEVRDFVNGNARSA
jgi:type IV secretion system protein TrbL